jgi:hypothetical protein
MIANAIASAAPEPKVPAPAVQEASILHSESIESAPKKGLGLFDLLRREVAKPELLERGVLKEHHTKVIQDYSAAIQRIFAVKELIFNRHVREGVDQICRLGNAIIINCRDKDPKDIYEDTSLGVRLDRAASMIEQWADYENGQLDLSPKAKDLVRKTTTEIIADMRRVYDRMLRNDDIATIARISGTYSLAQLSAKEPTPTEGEGT